MGNKGQQGATMDNNGQQWATMDNNGQQWTTMDNNGQQWTTTTNSAILQKKRFCPDNETSRVYGGYREVEDQVHLFTERHKFNIQTVDGKMMQREFVVASPQQQQTIVILVTTLALHVKQKGGAWQCC